MSETMSSRTSQKTLAVRNQLVTDHMNLVSAIARNVAAALPSHIEIEELTQAGAFGLIDAADRYDAGKRIPFPTYAKHRIRGAILDHLRAQDWVSRGLRVRERQLAQAESELTGVLKRKPSDEELATHLDGSLERVRNIRRESAISAPDSADSARQTQEAESRPREIAGRTSDRPDVMASRSETAEILRDAVALLPARYGALIRMYYEGDLTMKEIGRNLGINESRVSQIHRTAIAKLSETLGARGVNAAMLFEPAASGVH